MFPRTFCTKTQKCVLSETVHNHRRVCCKQKELHGLKQESTNLLLESYTEFSSDYGCNDASEYSNMAMQH